MREEERAEDCRQQFVQCFFYVCQRKRYNVFLCKGTSQLADGDADQREMAGGMKSDRNF